ncbi:hypothetical protein BJ973_000417 [Actinoplanes tereljensis]|uniref:Uncharacterized protein n=1 Tax=Paractinoplanes tereljensis TaxID=571912 RepID=A0A919TWT7_9ACTN|nr:hypothetical protein [Actinoplanes tereljensis]GIF23227.1 hypothetical protein Ate02nite_59570 [Actinoplanes tereljensis]
MLDIPIWSNILVDVPDLVALVPEMMVRHSTCSWDLLSGRAPREDLVLRLRLDAAPERPATVRVFLGAEVFILAFAGAESVDFAYEDSDRLEVLQERIDLAVLVMRGPTRLIRDSAKGITVSASLILDISGASTRLGSSYPLRRMKAFVTGRKIEHEIVEFPAVHDR